MMSGIDDKHTRMTVTATATKEIQNIGYITLSLLNTHFISTDKE